MINMVYCWTWVWFFWEFRCFCSVIAFFIPPWILLQTNHQQPVEVQLLGGIEKVEEEVEIREEAEEEEGGEEE